MIHKYNFSLYLKLILIISTFISVALIVNLWLFFQPSSIEISIAHWMQFGRPDWLTLSMRTITDSFLAMGIIAGSLCIVSLIKKYFATATVLALSLASLLLIDPVKNIFQRPRPSIDVPILDYISGTSFPSGHAFTATILAGIVCIAYIVGWRGRRVIMSFVIAMFYILLMSWSRVYLQVHYPSDVIGGMLLGLVILALLSYLYRWMRRKYSWR